VDLRKEWRGVIEWRSVPFAAPGDSGSFVFAREDGIHIPLGIHVGSPESMPNTGVFISLDTFCLEAEEEGGINIPLGTHVGSPDSMPNTSIFISSDTFCLEAEVESLELHFCHQQRQDISSITDYC
jgi:hypothetical protein